MGVRVSLFSKDDHLVELVRETVAHTPGSGFTFEVNSSDRLARKDLSIWDFAAGQTVLPLDADRNDRATDLFLVDREDIGALRAMTGTSDRHVMLKPVTRSALRAFLEDYDRGHADGDDGHSAGAPSFRSERDELLQMLMRANLKLQQFHQDRNNFLARSIHDFRAPLTAISGYCELLLGSELEPVTAGQRKMLQRMQQSIRRLTRATNSTFQLGVVASSEEPLNLEQADIRECISQALEELSTLLENKRITVTVEIEPPPESLLFEKAKVEQVLVNLLENAGKFTPKDGTIGVRGYQFFWKSIHGRLGSLDLQPDDQPETVEAVNSFRVDIIDSGPAIPAVEVDRIFEEHTQYSGGQDRSGAGLGMATCRMILSQHGGHVWAESTASGGAFSFVLPLL